MAVYFTQRRKLTRYQSQQEDSCWEMDRKGQIPAYIIALLDPTMPESEAFSWNIPFMRGSKFLFGLRS